MLTKSLPPARQHTPRLSRGGGGVEDKDSGGSGKRPVRAKRAFSIDATTATASSGLLQAGDSNTNTPSATSTGTGKRKRSSSLWVLPDGGGGGREQQEGGSLEDGATTAPPVTVPLKRGRKKGQIYGPSSGKASTNTSSQSQSHAITSAQFLKAQAALAEKAGYRRAHLDPATGEVYEGEWLNGQRNGFGVALFPDGTL